MLTPEETAAVKVGDKLRLTGLEEPYEKYNNIVVTVVEIYVHKLWGILFKTNPSFKEWDYLSPTHAELLSNAGCTCPTWQMSAFGCKCGAFLREQTTATKG